MKIEIIEPLTTIVFRDLSDSDCINQAIQHLEEQKTILQLLNDTYTEKVYSLQIRFNGYTTLFRDTNPINLLEQVIEALESEIEGIKLMGIVEAHG